MIGQSNISRKIIDSSCASVGKAMETWSSVKDSTPQEGDLTPETWRTSRHWLADFSFNIWRYMSRPERFDMEHMKEGPWIEIIAYTAAGDEDAVIEDLIDSRIKKTYQP
jgi:hypothetical protein